MVHQTRFTFAVALILASALVFVVCVCVFETMSAPPSRKRVSLPVGTSRPATKKIRIGTQSAAAAAAAAVAENPSAASYTVDDQHDTNNDSADQRKLALRNRFLKLFTLPEFKSGISNSALKERMGDAYLQLAPIINDLTKESRLSMSRMGGGGGGTVAGGSDHTELFYTLVAEDMAAKFSGLDVTARMVYQIIDKAGDRGIWTKDIRMQSNIQQQALNKIFKSLESRRLIKPVKSVNAKAKKLYMVYDLTPSKELTGGVWYSDLEFDYDFIAELRTFLVQCVRRLNGGRGVTLREIRDKMLQANVSRVDLSLNEIAQLLQTLIYDYIVEESGLENEAGEILYVSAKRLSSLCEFKWWDVLAPDFHFRTIVFEDGVTLAPHEPHYHTA